MEIGYDFEKNYFKTKLKNYQTHLDSVLVNLEIIN